MVYLAELVIAGAVSGSLYALVALAFIVVYKATRVVNFARGELVMFATGFAALGLHRLGLGVVGAIGVGVVGITGLAIAFNHAVLRHLVGRPPLAFIMVTIGFGAFLRGVATFVFAGVPQSIELPFPRDPVILLGVLLSPHELLVGVVALTVIGLVSWYTAGYIDPLVNAPLSGVVVYGVLVLALLFRPYGLFGERRVERV